MTVFENIFENIIAKDHGKIDMSLSFLLWSNALRGSRLTGTHNCKCLSTSFTNMYKSRIRQFSVYARLHKQRQHFE